MKIFIGADHGGFDLKKSIESHLNAVDINPEFTAGDDYPLVAHALCRRIVNAEDRGILICTSGIGMSIAANKVRGIRAALCRTIDDARRARQDNNANVLCLGASDTSARDALHIIKTFLNTNFLGTTKTGSRHLRREKELE